MYCWPSPIKTTFYRLFSREKMCALGQHCTTLARRYSYAMLEASRTTLHRVFSDTILSQGYKGNTEQDFSYAILSGASRRTIHKVFCAMLSQEILLGQHCTDKNHVQCCPRGFKQDCTGKILSNVVLKPMGQH